MASADPSLIDKVHIRQIVSGSNDNGQVIAIVAEITSLESKLQEKVRSALRCVTNGALDAELIAEVAVDSKLLLERLPDCAVPLKEWAADFALLYAKAHRDDYRPMLIDQ